MDRTSSYQRMLATVAIFVLAAGDAVRHTASWWGWGLVTAVALAAIVVELVRRRPSLRGVPTALWVLLVVMGLSTIWSHYPLETVLGVTATLATTAAALYLATVLSFEQFVRALATATKAIVALSLAFEVFVSAVIRRPLLPLWVDYSELETIPAAFNWSRNLLLEGGRIQGIVGNANYLALAALLCLITVGALWLCRLASARSTLAWAALAVLTLALTRSATITVAAIAVALVMVIAVISRRFHRQRRIIEITGLSLFVVGVALAVALRASVVELLGRGPDLTNRIPIWESVTELALERPVLGWGWISYWAPWVDPLGDLAVFRGVTYLSAHNAWLDAWLQIGVVGLAILVSLVAVTSWRSWRIATRPEFRGLRAESRPGLELVPLALMVLLLVLSAAESRMLVEIGWTLLVVCALVSTRVVRGGGRGTATPADRHQVRA